MVDHWVVNVHKGIASLFSFRYPEPKDARKSSTTYTLMEVGDKNDVIIGIH